MSYIQQVLMAKYSLEDIAIDYKPEPEVSNEGFFKTIGEGIAEFFKWILDKLKAFGNWVASFFTSSEKRNKGAIEKVKKATDEAVEKAIVKVTVKHRPATSVTPAKVSKPEPLVETNPEEELPVITEIPVEKLVDNKLYDVEGHIPDFDRICQAVREMVFTIANKGIQAYTNIIVYAYEGDENVKNSLQSKHGNYSMDFDRLKNDSKYKFFAAMPFNGVTYQLVASDKDKATFLLSKTHQRNKPSNKIVNKYTKAIILEKLNKMKDYQFYIKDWSRVLGVEVAASSRDIEEYRKDVDVNNLPKWVFEVAPTYEMRLEKLIMTAFGMINDLTSELTKHINTLQRVADTIV